MSGSDDGDEATKRRKLGAQAGIVVPDTLPDSRPQREPRTRDVEAGLEAAADAAARYEGSLVLGAGGMGEVRLCRDRTIGREIAMKRIRAELASGDARWRSRFVREARVQGQLEHPSIVPVYDLAVADRDVFFTMKVVRGRTLRDVLGSHRRGDAEIEKRFSRQKLLTAFASVCHAVDLAHSHGVVHRDIKPANVMLGDFGEVYLLDWGLAKIVGDSVEDSKQPEAIASVHVQHVQQVQQVQRVQQEGGATERDAFLGTPGYMAPEQMSAAGSVDARADVYALGAILFEIVALEPLHTGGVEALAASTLSGVEARPSVRAPHRDVAPELERLCVAATEVDRARRLATVRELVEGVERFLDGDRDLELRRKLAATHAETAVRAAQRAAENDAESNAERSRALGEAGRALSLDPTNELARRALLKLMTEPPRALPETVRADFAHASEHAIRLASAASIAVYPMWILGLALMVWMGVRSWLPVVVMFAAPSAATLLALRNKVARRPTRATLVWAIALRSIGLAALSAVLGPLVVVPGLAAVYAMAVAVHADKRVRAVTLACTCLAVLVPLGIEWAAVVPPSYEFRAGLMEILPRAVSLPRIPTLVFLAAVGFAGILGSALVVGRLRDALTAAERRLQLHAWQLSQLVPDVPRGTSEERT